MACPALGLEALPPLQPEPPPEPAFSEAQKWIEQVTGRSFGDKDFRTGLENGILLCELLNAIKPGLVKKINRLPTPIAGLDNIILFLRGCKELGLKESQLFDPSDLQDTSNRVTVKSLDYSRKLKNVLVTIYWLGKAANSCTSYSGTTLNLKEFEGLLAQMRKETDDIESPKRSIRDSGYIDCWDSERSDSLSPPRHGRDDSFDSLDSFGSRSRQTPSPDVVLRGSSDGRGSDSESDLPHRKLPDVKKDDMSARRTSHGEPKSAVPFNQYLPNKSNQTAYVPAPLRKKKAEREEYRKSWSTATSPLGGERPFSYPETIEEEEGEVGSPGEEDQVGQVDPGGKPSDGGLELPNGGGKEHPSSEGAVAAPAPKAEEKDAAEIQKRRRLERAGIKVMPAAQRFASQKQLSEEKEGICDIILRKENPFLTHQHGKDSESEDEVACRLPDLEKDDFAARRARMNQPKPAVTLNQLLYGPYRKKEGKKSDGSKQLSKGISEKRSLDCKRNQGQTEEVKSVVTCVTRARESEPMEEGLRKVPDLFKDDLAQRRIQGRLAPHRGPLSFVTPSNITEADLQTWERLKVSEETRDGDAQHICTPEISPEIKAETAIRDDFASRKARAYKKASGPRQKFVHFGPVTEIDQQKWKRLSIGKAGPREDVEEVICHSSKMQIYSESPALAATSSLQEDQILNPQDDCRRVNSGMDDYGKRASQLAPVPESRQERVCSLGECPQRPQEVTSKHLPQDGKEENEGVAQRDSEMPPKAERSEESSQPLACPLASEWEASGTEEKSEKMTAPAWSGSGLKGQRKLSDSQKDDMMGRRTEISLRHAGSNPNQFLPVPFAKQQEVEERAKGPPMKDHRYGLRTPVSDDAESTSLFDMRCEEEAAVQPHSRARQEQLQLINNQLREEDDKWQDDLARWKSRRRSASQDLIKKEEERKKMEKLLAGEDGTSERRKSIKTYREIVQEKERRERELHEAYKNAKSQEEAEGILQQYIERFTISEAVLERLEMPKILERSHSTEPNLSSFPNDPNPMRYLRQQSLPPPKFTATVETTVARASVPDASTSADSGSPSKTVTPKAVPMLTPKPYSQPKNSQEVLKTFKADGKVSMNGETIHGDTEQKQGECPTVAPAPSLTKSQMFEGVARVHGSPVELKQDNNGIEINIKKPNSVPQELTATTEETEPKSQEDENDGGNPRKGNIELASSEPQHFTTTVTRCSPTVAFVELSSSPQLKNDVSEEKEQKKPEHEMSGKVELVLSQKVVKPKSPEPEATLTFPFLDKMPETNQLHLPNLNSQEPPGMASVPLRVQNSWRRSQFFSRSADSPSSEKSPVTTPFKFWAWDPEEERRRQEKWQQEQERLLQERYQKEQNKLKEEWEKAQKEVEEEERRYYEEERKIIEDTVVPFSITSSSADQLSTSTSMTEGPGTVNKMDLENCQDKEQERRQKKSFQGDANDILLKTRESDPLQEKGSLAQEALAHSENAILKGIHQDHPLDTQAGPPHCGMNPQLAQDLSQNQQVSNPPMHISEDVKPKTLPLDKSMNHQIESPSERRKKSPRESFQAGPLSPCSPTPPGQSPNRSISGKKLCSSCGLPLGKGAAMIIETLNLYFHIQCFRCGICKGQLGDAVSGTDVRIRNGLLNCNDCYLRSRSAGQPTTL